MDGPLFLTDLWNGLLNISENQNEIALCLNPVQTVSPLYLLWLKCSSGWILTFEFAEEHAHSHTSVLHHTYTHTSVHGSVWCVAKVSQKCVIVCEVGGDGVPSHQKTQSFLGFLLSALRLVSLKSARNSQSFKHTGCPHTTTKLLNWALWKKNCWVKHLVSVKTVFQDFMNTALLSVKRKGYSAIIRVL